MRGIHAIGTHVPHFRLRSDAVGAFHGSGAKPKQRSVATYDEDTTTMGVAAARRALRGSGLAPDALWFATPVPTYLEKSNASIAHAALRLGRGVTALDLGAANASAFSALLAALESDRRTLVVGADMRLGLPGSSDETDGGDGAVAVLVGSGEDVALEYLGSAVVSEEFLDRWRIPGEARTRQWEERFGETRYGAAAWECLDDLEQSLGLNRGAISTLVVTGQSPRAAAAVTKRGGASADEVSARIGNTGAAQPLFALAAAAESAAKDDIVVVMHLSEGATAAAFQVRQPTTQAPSLQAQLDGGDDSLPYAKYLRWREMLDFEPPRRPEPARASASAASRRSDWKFGFVGSKDTTTGTVHLPPQRVSFDNPTIDDNTAIEMADRTARIATFTIDRLVYSVSPPVVFAIVDFEGGGRFPLELTDCSPDDVEIGAEVEMSFRRLNTADGIANYFWKGTLVPTDSTTRKGAV